MAEDYLFQNKDLIKKFGQGAFISGDDLVLQKEDMVQVSPKIDIILGGGIPGGSVVTLSGAPKCGKMQPLSSIVWTPNGPTTMFFIKVGDMVCNPYGGFSKVTDVFFFDNMPMFEVEFDNGDKCKCGIDHLWKVYVNEGNDEDKQESVVVDVEYMLKTGVRDRFDKPRYSVEITQPIKMGGRDVRINPYHLGKYLRGEDVELDSNVLRAYKIDKHNIFIPPPYKYNDIETRLALLNSLLGEGELEKKYTVYVTPHAKLAKDIKEMVEGLGYLCTINFNNDTHECHISTEQTRRYIVAIRYIGHDSAKCIKLDSEDGLYLTNHCIVTHNTTLSLHILGKCQQMGRPIFYVNVEGRIKQRDLDGIRGLDKSKLNIVRSYRNSDNTTHILTAEEFLEIVESIIHTYPRASIVVDSISQLATSGEFEKNIGEQSRAPGAVLMAQLCKRLCNVIPINETILIGILHHVANTSGYGKSYSVTGGNKIKYAQDIGLECKGFKLIEEGGKIVGQTVEWLTVSTAIAPPGQTTESVLRYGIGIDEIAELVDVGIDVGFIEQGGAWFTLNFLNPPVKLQGKPKVINHIKENEAAHISLLNSVRGLIYS